MAPEVTICECVFRIEATSYSHPTQVPAFADTAAVLSGIARRPGSFDKAAYPNLRAIHRPLDDLAAGHGANKLSLLAFATDRHTQRNLKTTRAEQWNRIEAMALAA